jgi:hypothetical protein
LKQLSKAIKSPFRLEGDNNNGPWESEVVSGFLFLTTIQENPVRVWHWPVISIDIKCEMVTVNKWNNNNNKSVFFLNNKKFRFSWRDFTGRGREVAHYWKSVKHYKHLHSSCFFSKKTLPPARLPIVTPTTCLYTYPAPFTWHTVATTTKPNIFLKKEKKKSFGHTMMMSPKRCFYREKLVESSNFERVGWQKTKPTQNLGFSFFFNEYLVLEEIK